MNERFYLGWDVGGTKCAAVIGTEDGQIAARAQWPSDARRGPDAMIEDFLAQAQKLRRRFDVTAAGVAIGGPLDADQGVVLGPPNLPGWNQIPLRERLRKALALSVAVEHDAAACALAEHRWGAGRGADHLSYLTCGTGFGVGLILGGKVYHGAGGLNPEIGHVRLRDDGPIAFGVRGSAEAFCSAKSLSALAGWMQPRRWGVEPPTPAGIAALAGAGDADAQAVLQLNAHAVGDVCALLSDLLRLELILIGSLARYLGESWLARIRKRCADQSLDGGATCRILPAGLGEQLQDCSALAVALAAIHDA